METQESKILNLIVLYERGVDNMEWHLRVNGWNIDEREKEFIQKRIYYQQEFINDLKYILK